VLHAGYEAFLDRHPDANEILLLGASFADEFKVIRKEIRALAPDRAAAYLDAVRPGSTVRVIEREDLPKAVGGNTLVLPDEDLTRELVERYGLVNVTFEGTFLRWDRSWSQAGRPADFDGTVSTDELARALMGTAITEAARSSDWWRQVGALAARGAEVLDVAHNEHQPTEYSPYLNGDPRNDFSRGVRMDLSTALHAEAAIIGRAARAGVPLDGADLYVSTFPCPSCARLVAAAGFRRCYFAGPYAVLDGDEVLRQAGVELIWVDLG
jgi:deoxycytidylate deaminase